MFAKQKLSPPPTRGRLIFCLLLGFLCACLPPASKANSLEDAARAFARKVIASIKPASVTFEIENISSLSDQRVSELSRDFQKEIQDRNVKILPANAEWKIHLLLSNNATDYLCIARLYRNDISETLIEILGQSGDEPRLREEQGMTLRRELIFSSDQPILDLFFPDEATNKIEVLDGTQISSYERNGDHWVRQTSIRLPRSVLVDRDLRGEIDLGIDAMRVIFPSEICNLSVHDGDHCHANRGRLKLTEAAEEILEGEQIPAWITASRLQNAEQNLLLVVGQDGAIRVYGTDPKPLATFSGFGDQLTSIRSACTSGLYALAALRGDHTRLDSVEGIEIRDLKPVVVTQPLQFEGPVIALRHATRSVAAQPSSAIAISLNLSTGLYEVYRLTLTCAN